MNMCSGQRMVFGPDGAVQGWEAVAIKTVTYQESSLDEIDNAVFLLKNCFSQHLTPLLDCNITMGSPDENARITFVTK